MGRCNGDLTLVIGSDDLAQTAHHIFLLERVHDELLKLRGDEIAAVGIHTLGEHIVEHTFAAQMQTEILAVSVRRSAGLGFAGRFLGLLGDGRGYGLCKLCGNSVAALHASDLIGEIVQFLLHIGVNGIVLGRQNAFSVAVGVEEALHRSPQLGALFAQFNDSHIEIPPY